MRLRRRLGPEQYRRFGFNMDGPLVKGKTSLALNVDGNANYDSQTIVADTPEGRLQRRGAAAQ